MIPTAPPSRREAALLAAAALAALLACERQEEPPVHETTQLEVSCLDMIVDDDPLVAHTPPAFDDQGNRVHACELHLQRTVKNGFPVVELAHMRFHLLGRWWKTTGGSLSSESGFTQGDFHLWIAEEECPSCPTRELRGPYSYCDLRNTQGCAYEACRDFVPEAGACAAQWESGLSKKLSFEVLPYQRLEPSAYGKADLRLLAEGEATECRALWSRSSGGLEIALQLGTWNRVDVAKLFGATCAAGQAAHNRLEFRATGVQGAGTYGPLRPVAVEGATAVARLPELHWPLPVAFLSMTTPTSGACDDHGGVELGSESECTLELAASRFELTCERARFIPPTSPVIPEFLSDSWGFDRPPEMLVQVRASGDCELREVP
ncbi:MAG: hypothetical protein IT376_02100 [Polyangiaceae bacterium]|nr:hypothetical protein [Polyangiaceae bacterium]